MDRVAIEAGRGLDRVIKVDGECYELVEEGIELPSSVPAVDPYQQYEDCEECESDTDCNCSLDSEGPRLRVSITWKGAEAVRTFFGCEWKNGETKELCPTSYKYITESKNNVIKVPVSDPRLELWECNVGPDLIKLGGRFTLSPTASGGVLQFTKHYMTMGHTGGGIPGTPAGVVVRRTAREYFPLSSNNTINLSQYSVGPITSARPLKWTIPAVFRDPLQNFIVVKKAGISLAWGTISDSANDVTISWTRVQNGPPGERWVFEPNF